MPKKILVLLFCIIPLLPVFSNGKKDKPEKEKQGAVSLFPEKQVEGLSVSDGRLSLKGDNRDIAFGLKADKYMKTLDKAETYTHAYIERPDGPVGMLDLMDGDGTVCWVGDGVRANMGPSGLTILPGKEGDEIKVKSDGKNWNVPLKTETDIVWNDEDYIVFVSSIRKGKMQDQPDFAVDLVIIRK